MPTVRRVRWAKIRVVFVAAVALIIFGTFTSLLTGGNLFSSKAVIYLYIPDATGLGADSPVRVDGINIGKVSSVALSGDPDPLRVVRVRMTVQLAGLQTIPTDSYAQLSTETLIGDK